MLKNNHILKMPPAEIANGTTHSTTKEIFNNTGFENEIAVDLNNTDEFTPAHLETNNNLINKDAWPEFYGTNDTDFRFLGFKLIPISSVDDDTDPAKAGVQDSRAVDNPEYNKIKNDILTNGFKLRYNPIQVKEYTDKNGNTCYSIINGRTRAKILRHSTSCKNIIVAVYKISKERDFITQGVKNNCTGVPEGTANKADVIRAATILIQKGLMSKNKKGSTKWKEDIKEWLYDAVGNGPFTDDTKLYMLSSIIKNASIRPDVFSWRKEAIETWMLLHGFEPARKKYKTVQGMERKTLLYYDGTASPEDQNKYLYMVTSFSSESKALWRAASILSKTEFKGKVLRIIFHTSTLDCSASSNDLTLLYNDRLRTIKGLWHEGLDMFAKSYFNDQHGEPHSVKTDAVLYGALPAIRSEHDMDALVLF